jgi:hypothetical protein
MTAPTIANLMLGMKSMNNGTLAQYLSGDIAEMMVYDAPLTNSELDRLGYILICMYVHTHTLNDAPLKNSDDRLGCICVYEYSYIYTHTRTYTHTHTHTYAYRNYLAGKYALPYMRLNEDYKSASRTVALSCSSCISPGPIGEGGRFRV